MKRWKTLAIMAVFLTLVMSTAVPCTTALSLQKYNAIKISSNNPISNLFGSRREMIVDISFDIYPEKKTAEVKVDVPDKTVNIKPGETIFLYAKISMHVHSSSKSHPIYVGRVSFKYLSVVEGFSIILRKHDFDKEGRYDLFYVHASKSAKEGSRTTVHVWASASIKIEGNKKRDNDDGYITVVVTSKSRSQQTPSTTNLDIATKPREYKSTSSITNPISPVPSITNPAVTTNPIMSKLFETISEQINSYNGNVGTTPSTTPSVQPTPSTRPNEGIQIEPTDVPNTLA